MTQPLPAAGPRTAVHLPNHYAWFIAVGTLDLILTYVVLRLGGIEVNAVAARAIEVGGLWGLIALKFASVILVVLICEMVAERRPATARRLAVFAIAASALPVLVASGQLAFVGLAHAHLPGGVVPHW